MQAVMLVAGKSTRTYPLTLTRPKPLLPIANVPIIKYNLDQMSGLFNEIIMIVGYRKEMIQNDLGNEYKRMKVIYQEQKEQLGTGHAILQAKPYISGRFVAMNGDDLFTHEDFINLIKFQNGALVKNVKNPSSYGVYQVDEKNVVLDLVEKPKKYIGNLANIGCYVLDIDVFDELETTPLSERGEIEITSAVLSLAQKRKFYVQSVSGYWLPTGYAWDLIRHQEFFLKMRTETKIEGQVEKNTTLKGHVEIGNGTLIKAGSYIEGPVIIGKNCEIGPNAYISKYSAIGNNCYIGSSVEIRNSIIMENCQIAHLCHIADSVLGESVFFDVGVIVLNELDNNDIESTIKGQAVNTGLKKFGTVVGDNAHVGTSTIINPGRKIWPGMLIQPNRIIFKDEMKDLN